MSLKPILVTVTDMLIVLNESGIAKTVIVADCHDLTAVTLTAKDCTV